MGFDEKNETVFLHPVQMHSPLPGETMNALVVRNVIVIARGPIAILTGDMLEQGSALHEMINRVRQPTRETPAKLKTPTPQFDEVKRQIEGGNLRPNLEDIRERIEAGNRAAVAGMAKELPSPSVDPDAHDDGTPVTAVSAVLVDKTENAGEGDKPVGDGSELDYDVGQGLNTEKANDPGND